MSQIVTVKYKRRKLLTTQRKSKFLFFSDVVYSRFIVIYCVFLVLTLVHVERLSNVRWQAALHQIGQDRLQIFKLYIDVWR